MKRENEMKRALNNYFAFDEGTKMQYYGTGIAAKEFVEMLEKGEKFIGEAPDMLILKDNTAFIVEHFEFDSYKKIRNGSKNRIEQSRIAELEQNMSKKKTVAYYYDKIHGTPSYENYIQSVYLNFKKHYVQINKYKENLKKHGLINDSMIVKTMFLIEDTSPIGSMVVLQNENNSSLQPVCLCRCKEFLSLLEESPNVDYILSCSMIGNDKIVFFVDRNEMEEYKKECIDYSKLQFVDKEPNVFGFQIPMSNN